MYINNMKSVFFLVIIGLFSVIIGCNYFKPDHPQAEITDTNATNLTAKSILTYTDSVDRTLANFEKKTSLVYRLGDLSFYVEEFNHNNQTILLIERANSGGISNSLKKYYLKNDSLVLIDVRNELANDDGTVFKDMRIFMRNNTAFRLTQRTASSLSAIKTLPYIETSLTQSNLSSKNYLENISTLKDVIAANNQFDVVFESITTYPDSRYIILKSKLPNSYTATVLVNQKDALIDSLLNDPLSFKDEKLRFSWIVKNQEAIYVPVGNNTAASGLNK